MLETKERRRVQTPPPSKSPEVDDEDRYERDQSRPEMIIVIGLVAVISMAFGFLLGFFL
jgi:hypothetical protein